MPDQRRIEEAEYLELTGTGLRDLGIPLSPGLAPSEIEAIEAAYRLRFPPDLRRFLERWLPTGAGFPNWRGDDTEQLRLSLSWPTESVCFDIERNGFWMASWGPRPAEMIRALDMARSILAKAPKLLPIYKHRYIPSEPMVEGNPVFSVYQSDVIRYGNAFQDTSRPSLGFRFRRGLARSHGRFNSGMPSSQ